MPPPFSTTSDNKLHRTPLHNRYRTTRFRLPRLVQTLSPSVASSTDTLWIGWGRNYADRRCKVSGQHTKHVQHNPKSVTHWKIREFWSKSETQTTFFEELRIISSIVADLLSPRTLYAQQTDEALKPTRVGTRHRHEFDKVALFVLKKQQRKCGKVRASYSGHLLSLCHFHHSKGPNSDKRGYDQ